MLGRMIFGSQALLTEKHPPAAPADYIVASDAEWNAVFAKSAATLAGKIVEIRGSTFTQRTIADKDLDIGGGRLTIRSADSNASLPSILFNGTVRGIDFSGLNFQMKGWPKMYSACVTFNNGTFGKLRFLDGTTFRHGYGPTQADIDTGAELPEYVRIDNVQTASTTSTVYPLTWEDPAAPSGWIEFFNRGAETVYVAVGGPGVVATNGSTACAAGQRVRISSGVTPSATTHFAILAVSGNVLVNARTEIGLSEYLADAFASSGAAVIEDLEFRNCLFRDLSNGMKNIFKPTSLVVMDCDFDRIYQDIIAAGPRTGGTAYFFRNIESLPFARSGISENEKGDARDPHGDQYQMFSDNVGTIGPIYYAGNRIRPGSLRSDVSSQGILVGNNLTSPSYSRLYFVSTMYVGGAPIGMTFGNTGFPVSDTLIYGSTIVDWRDAADPMPIISIAGASDGSVYVGSTIVANFAELQGPVQRDNLLLLSEVASPTAVFPNLLDLDTASNRADIEAAITPTAEGAGLGAVAAAAAVDWTATDPTQVIRWENVPSGAHWNPLTSQSVNTLITLPLRKILNRRDAQDVSVGTGTEWRSVAIDGTTEVQAWTSSPGTIEPDQFIQIRCRSAAEGSRTVTAAVAVNGFEQKVDITTANVPSAYLVQGNSAGRFEDPANTPAGVRRMTFRGKFFFPTGTLATGDRLVSQGFGNCLLDTTTSSAFRISVADSLGASMLSGTVSRHVGSLVTGTWLDIVFDVNMTVNQATLSVNGVTETYPFTATSSGALGTPKFILLARGAGLNEINSGVRFADLSLDFDGMLHKAIPNDATNANADPWKQGGAFTGA